MTDTTRPTNTGAVISLLAAIVGLLCYFLPWLEGGMFGFTSAVSAFRFLTEAQGGALPLQLLLSLLALLAALLAAGAAVFKQQAAVRKDVSAVLILTGLISTALLGYLYFEFQSELNRQPSDPFGQLLQGLARSIVTVNILYGAYGAFFSSLAVLLGGLIGWFASPAVAAGEAAGPSSGFGIQAYAPPVQPPLAAPSFPAPAPQRASPGCPCFRCGAQVRAGAAFCGACGTRLPG